MENYVEACGWQAVSILIYTTMGAVVLLIGWMLQKKVSKLLKWSGNEISTSPEDVAEMTNATLQISRDWKEVAKVMLGIREDQKNFINQLQKEIEHRNEAFCQKITISLEEEFLRNDQRFTKMKRTIEVMQEDLQSIKNSLQNMGRTSRSPRASEESNNSTATVVDSFAQTEYEIKRKAKDGHTKNGVNSEGEARLVTMVKKCLTDLMKDAKLHLSIDREEENRELQIIFSKLAEDREDIKKTIVHAFSLAAEQSKKNYDQFGEVGQDSMHYIAVLNENTNKMLKIKFEEADSRLKDILNALNKQIFDITAIRETLDNIDSQFDDIFQRAELSTQKNTEYCEEIAQNLEKASDNWANTATELGAMTNSFADDIKNVKTLLAELKILMGSVKQKSEDNSHSSGREHCKIVKYEDSTHSSHQQWQASSQEQRSLIFMYSMIKTCWDKMIYMNNNMGKGIEEIYQVIQILMHKLQSLNESINLLENTIRSVNTGFFTEGTTTHCLVKNTGEIESMVRENMQDGGDCQPQVYQKIRNVTLTENLTQSIQNAISVDKEVKMIDLILRKVYEKSIAKSRKASEIPLQILPENIGHDRTETFQNLDEDVNDFNHRLAETEEVVEKNVESL